MNVNRKYKQSNSIGAFHASRMLHEIPADVRYLFTPGSEDELAQLEMNIVRWLSRAPERDKVMKLQRHYNLPLRPEQSLRDVVIRIRILELKNDQKFEDSYNDCPPDQEMP